MDNSSPLSSGISSPNSFPDHPASFLPPSVVPGYLAPGGSFCALTGLPPVSNTGGNYRQTVRDATGFSSCIDTLTVTVPGYVFDDDLFHARTWVDRFSRGALAIGGCLSKQFNGYAECYDIICPNYDKSDKAMLGWVGISSKDDYQRGYWCFHLTGIGCGLMDQESWEILCNDGKKLDARITRCDCAVDDISGSHSWQNAYNQYQEGLFKNPNGGRQPSAKIIVSNNGKGNTLYVGNRQSGKMLRVYEKGKQLGDVSSPWVRYEVEYRSKDRVLPWDMLLDPAAYVRGAYPTALSWVALTEEPIKVKKLKAEITVNRLMEHCRQQAGRFINYCLDILGMKSGQIVASLSAPAGRYPLRLIESVIAIHREDAQVCAC